jgi:hypothetical protein
MATTTQTSLVGGLGLVVGTVLGAVLGVATPQAPGDVVETQTSKVAWLTSGEKVYSVLIKHSDGGVETVYQTAAPCKRRPSSVAGVSCLLTTRGDGGMVAMPAPAMLRFEASRMSGLGCEPIACSVWAGVDDAAPEERP